MPAHAYPFLDHPGVLAFAHRGAHGDVEENTDAAFEEAVRLGYRYVETDAQASRDGVPVLFHDDTLDRVMGAPGAIGERDWPEISQLRTPRGAGLMRLEDALAAFPETRFNVDAKSDAVVEPLAQAIRSAGAADRVCVASFDVRRTLAVRRLVGADLCWSPSHRGVFGLWLSGWGIPSPRPGFPAVQTPTGFHGVPVVTRRFIAAAHRRGVQVHVWTIDDDDEMDRLLDLGVDGVMTDRAELLKSVLIRRGQWAD